MFWKSIELSYTTVLKISLFHYRSLFLRASLIQVIYIHDSMYISVYTYTFIGLDIYTPTFCLQTYLYVNISKHKCLYTYIYNYASSCTSAQAISV